MDDRTRIQQDRPGAHRGLGLLVVGGPAVFVPPRTSRNDPGAAVGGREVGDGPHGVELRIYLVGDVAAPCQTVSVQRLGALAGLDVDDLGEVQLDLVRVRAQEPVGQADDFVVHHQFTARGRTSYQRTGAGGVVAREVVEPARRLVDPGSQLGFEPLHHVQIDGVLNDGAAIDPHYLGDLVFVAVQRETGKLSHAATVRVVVGKRHRGAARANKCAYWQVRRSTRIAGCMLGVEFPVRIGTGRQAVSVARRTCVLRRSAAHARRAGSALAPSKWETATRP